jgi:hypothetical protein
LVLPAIDDGVLEQRVAEAPGEIERNLHAPAAPTTSRSRQHAIEAPIPDRSERALTVCGLV